MNNQSFNPAYKIKVDQEAKDVVSIFIFRFTYSLSRR